MAVDPNDPATWMHYNLTLTYSLQAPTTDIEELARIASVLQQTVTDAITANPTLTGTPVIVRLKDDGRHGDIAEVFRRFPT